MPSRLATPRAPVRRLGRGSAALGVALAAGTVAWPLAPAAVAGLSPTAATVRPYGPPPSWSTQKGICSPVDLGGGRVRHGLPPSEGNIRVTSIRIVAKRRVTCSEARKLAKRWYLRGTKSGYVWRSLAAWGQDDGRGADKNEGRRKGGRRIVFIASN